MCERQVDRGNIITHLLSSASLAIGTPSPDQPAQASIVTARAARGRGRGASLQDRQDKTRRERGQLHRRGQASVEEGLVEGHVGGAEGRLAGDLLGDARGEEDVDGALRQAVYERLPLGLAACRVIRRCGGLQSEGGGKGELGLVDCGEEGKVG